MRAEDVCGIDRVDELLAIEFEEGEMLDFEPGEACPPGVRSARRPSTGAVSPLRNRRRPAAPRFYSGDELVAQTVLRPYTGNVLWVAPVSTSLRPCDLDTEFFNNDGAAAGTGRAA